MTSVKEILQELGYNVNRSTSTHYSCLPLYRGSNNHTALAINKSTGEFYDFVTGQKGKLEKLVRITLNFDSDDQAVNWLENKQYNFDQIISKPIIKMPKIFNRADYFLLPHSYWKEKGISQETLNVFGGAGVAHEAPMNRRSVFFILEESGSVVGLAGRLVTGDIPDESGRIGKWKIMGSKKQFLFPYYHNRLDIEKAEEVILVESIGDALALWECGFKNSLVLFGIEISQKIIAKLIEINPKKIIIATNNDLENSSAGNLAADKIINKLSQFFDKEKLYNGIPTDENDLMALFQKGGKNAIINWRNGLFLE